MRWQGAALVLVTLGQVCVGHSTAACWAPGNPLVVLDCYEDACEAKDVGAHSSLLASDFLAEYVPPQPGSVTHDRERAIAGFAIFVESKDSVEIEFTNDTQLEEGEDPGTWILDTEITRRFALAESEPVVLGPLRVLLHVREISGVAPRYEIYRTVTYTGLE